MNDTKARLVAAALDVLRAEGIAGLSARTIATRAVVNQALVFYHFKTVEGLVEAACRDAADAAVAQYRPDFAEVSSLSGLLALGRQLHDRERAAGNVAVMAQVLAGAQRSPVLAEAGRYALAAWVAEIESVLARVLGDSPIAALLDVPGLARAVSAAFVGMELYEQVDEPGATAALDALDRLGLLTDVLDDLGPVARKAVRSRLRKAARDR